tara:strand:+ start:832 stop:1266 length:435 start_codon:yes stop_codon:yes gene_type:complete
MALTQINGRNISQATNATISALQFLNTNGNAVLQLPVGTTAQRPTGIGEGTVRFNTTELAAEIYRQTAPGSGTNDWFPLAGGGPAIGDNSIIRTNANTINEDLTVGPTGTQTGAEFANGMSAGPITIATGRTVTVQSGAAWSVR